MDKFFGFRMLNRNIRVLINRRVLLTSDLSRKVHSGRSNCPGYQSHSHNDILDSPVLAPAELHVYRQMFHTNVLAPLGATCGFFANYMALHWSAPRTANSNL